LLGLVSAGAEISQGLPDGAAGSSLLQPRTFSLVPVQVLVPVVLLLVMVPVCASLQS